MIIDLMIYYSVSHYLISQNIILTQHILSLRCIMLSYIYNFISLRCINFTSIRYHILYISCILHILLYYILYRISLFHYFIIESSIRNLILYLFVSLCISLYLLDLYDWFSSLYLILILSIEWLSQYHFYPYIV